MIHPSQKINWHSAAYSALKIEFSTETNSKLHFHKEYPLNEKPRRIDALIIKDDTQSSLQNPLGAIFRKYNLIEYKSPYESLSISQYYKALSYAYSFITLIYDGSFPSVNDISLSLITHRFPTKLFQYISKCKIIIENPLSGVYYIKKESFPIQVIITTRLDPSRHIWLKSLTNTLHDRQEIIQLSNAYKTHTDDPEYNNFMNIIIRANKMAEKGAETMCEAMYELFAPQLKEHWDDGFNKGRDQINSLNAALIRDGRSDDLVRSFTDPDFQILLLEEYLAAHPAQ